MRYPPYLRDLAERLMRVPAVYGTDQGDVDTLNRIATEMEMRYENGRPKFANDGTMLDENGRRSIFDDVDE